MLPAMSSINRTLMFVFLLVFAFADASRAQTFRGGIAGRVADSTGAVLPGVTVTATNDATGVARTTVTSTNGDFSVPDLQLGNYTIEATLQGFQTLRTKVAGGRGGRGGGGRGGQPPVAAGSFSVKLSANGKSLTQPLAVKPDPRERK